MRQPWIYTVKYDEVMIVNMLQTNNIHKDFVMIKINTDSVSLLRLLLSCSLIVVCPQHSLLCETLCVLFFLTIPLFSFHKFPPLLQPVTNTIRYFTAVHYHIPLPHVVLMVFLLCCH